MFEVSYTYCHAIVGGILIGLASFLASYATGKIAGISGICARLMVKATPDKAWRATFLVGLVMGAGIAFMLFSSANIYRPIASWPGVTLAGLLVGIGTRLGGGCTSGHGVCGMGLGAKDSAVATITFMTFGILTVFLTQYLIA